MAATHPDRVRSMWPPHVRVHRGFSGYEDYHRFFYFREVNGGVNRELIVIQEDERGWETWPNEEDVRGGA
jgi:hypothetical protein